MSYQKEILNYQSDYIRLERAAEIGACADAEIAQLQCDAARYRWLRDKWYLNKDDSRCLDEVANVATTQGTAEFDAAIDAAKASGAEFHHASE